jgi:hypothetical protein
MDENHFGETPTRGVREVLYDRLNNALEAMIGLQQKKVEFERWLRISLNADDTLELVGNFDTLGKFQTSWDEGKAERDARVTKVEKWGREYASQAGRT